MRLVLELLRRFRFLVFRDRYSRELEEEMRLHASLREQRLRDQGLAAEAARLEARRRLGNALNLGERSRDAWGFRWLEHAAADARFAARRLRQRPGFSIATITVAALGIGASTAVFSATDATLLRPLPFLRPAELVTLPDIELPFDAPLQGRPPGKQMVEIGDVAGLRDVFSSTAAYAAGGLNLSDATNPLRVHVGVVTTGFFATLGVHPQRGRDFAADEGTAASSHVAILSDALWRTKFGGADMLGRAIDLSGTSYSVIGVMEPGVTFPSESDLWIPLPLPTTIETFAAFRGFLPTRVIARLAPGVSTRIASARLLAMWQRVLGGSSGARPSTILGDLRNDGAARSLRQDLVGDTRNAFLLLVAATALLLLIACANVANLLLSDAAGRRREVALRGVLGATRGRIIRQLLVESILLALVGAAVGVALAPVAFGLLRALTPANLAGVATARLDFRVLIFAVVLALVTGLVFGLWPAIGAARADAAETIKSGGAGATAARMGVTRRMLVVAELALTVMLLVGSGLMLRSFERVMSQQLGMNPERVGTLELSFAARTKRDQRLSKLHAIEARLGADPAIQSAGAVNDLPLRGGGGISISIQVDGRPAPQSVDEMAFSRYLMASGGYFKAMGIPLVRGRAFTASDDSLAPQVAIVDQAMANKWWPGGNAIGRSFHLGGGGGSPIIVVGIVPDVRETRLEADPLPQMYFPIDEQTPSNAAIVARSSLPPSVLLARMTDVVHAVDPTQAVYNVRMMEDVIGKSVAPRRTNTMLIAIFAGMALALSAFGVYAVVSHSVTRRAKEFGIRAALGATASDIASLVGREMTWTVAIGLLIGLAGAWALSRVMASLLYGVGVHDIATFAVAPVVLVLAALAATFLPARRAMRVNPTEVMRAE